MLLKKYFIRFTVLVVALQVLNMSVSGRAGYDGIIWEVSDSVNIADHAVEYFVENVLGFTQAYPEKNENRQQHNVSSGQKIQSLALFSLHPKSVLPDVPLSKVSCYQLVMPDTYNQYCQSIISPPPDWV